MLRDINENNGFSDESANEDSAIFIFPDDNDTDNTPSLDTDGTGTDNTGDSASPKLFGGSSSLAGKRASGSKSGLSFGHVDAVKKEKEYVYMPFLDIKDDPGEDEADDGEKTNLSFSKVKAVKKEHEFVFMPFLNDAAENEGEKKEETRKYQFRPDGTVFDEGLVLQPLSPLDDDDDESDYSGDDVSDSDDDEDDTGIYVTDAGPGGFIPRPATAPNRSRSKNGGKKPPQNGKRSKKGSKGKKGMPSADEQFRAAMMNINPEIRRAAMRDPIQRAALEQAVRIALVQQAAQEAVARTTGNPGGYGNNFGQPNPFVVNQGMGGGKKKRAPQAAGFQNNQSPASSLASSVRGFQLGGFNSAPAEFGTSPQAASSVSGITDAPVDSGDFNSAAQSTVHNPDVMQDPILASLSATSAGQGTPNSQQDPTIASLSRNNSTSTNTMSRHLSPAAVRAAIRAGVDVSNLPNNNASASAASLPQNSLSAQKAKLQEAVNTRRSGCLIWIIISFIVFFIGLIAIAVWPSLSTELKYQQAASMMAAGEYIDASNAFAALEDYKDSETKANEAIYTYATNKLEAGDYEGALTLFTNIESYSNTSECIAECRYALGRMHMQNGDYAEAYDQLRQIPRYSDAGELAKESNYKCAVELYEDGSYDAARVRFSMFPDYLDSYSLWQVSQYNYGDQLIEAEEYGKAYEMFNELGDYVNASFKAAISRYKLMLLGEEFPLEEVRATLDILEAYNSDPEAVAAISDPVFTQAKLLGRWQDENGYFYIEYKIDDGVPSFTFFISDKDATATTIEDVKFDGNLMFFQASDIRNPIIRVNAFAPEDDASPNTIDFFSYSINTSYVMYRSEQ